MRGESENRNKELKIELHAGRLSGHRFTANFFRLYLHTAALSLLVRLRHAVVQALPTCAELNFPIEVPTEALNRLAESFSTSVASGIHLAEVSPARGGPG